MRAEYRQLAASVGRGGRNMPSDVCIVQLLLTHRGQAPGRVDGVCGPRTIASIHSFQKGFMRIPDGLVQPRGLTWRHLTASGSKPVILTKPITSTTAGVSTAPAASMAPAVVAAPADLTVDEIVKLVPRPANGTYNQGLVAVSNDYMLDTLGKPRNDFSQDCQPITNEKLKKHIVLESVGPFRVTGFRPAVNSLRAVLAELATMFPSIYRQLGTAGMVCARNQRGSTTKISNHSWGTAIDLTLAGKLDVRGDNMVQTGLLSVATVFNKHGWYWGALFPTEDAMHFEAGRALVETWKGGLA